MTALLIWQGTANGPVLGNKDLGWNFKLLVTNMAQPLNWKYSTQRGLSTYSTEKS
jgi:hypothetical protein